MSAESGTLNNMPPESGTLNNMPPEFGTLNNMSAAGCRRYVLSGAVVLDDLSGISFLGHPCLLLGNAGLLCAKSADQATNS
ncbi:hypothetical protein Q31b_25040 [Novipirellula aureliae]|uniref:Uncharacterized protein n=1 Tax=Novipirellula aureliae TaxID=2527966 RepID=A0A5C6E1D1_9BACT|nr:hypothetical protein Q31b_25040 [Novipirellula aureliae]